MAQAQPQPNGSVFSPNAKILFCGNAARELFAWEVRPCQLDDPCPANFQMVRVVYVCVSVCVFARVCVYICVCVCVCK